MRKDILEYYKQVSPYTYAGAYQAYFDSLPNDIPELGKLICAQFINGIFLLAGNTGKNADLRYGDMNEVPWYRMRFEDDIFLTTVSMTAELFRMDERGFVWDRKTQNKIILTCRYVSVLASAVLKAKGLTCRSRAGFAPYIYNKRAVDHWVNQYWNHELDRWVTFDASLIFKPEDGHNFDQFDMTTESFILAPQAWINVRNGSVEGEKFVYVDGLGTRGLKALLLELFSDYHALRNHEISYLFRPCYIVDKFESMTEKDFAEIDELAQLMLEPDKNFNTLLDIWEKNKKFRILNSPSVRDNENAGTMKKFGLL